MSKLLWKPGTMIYPVPAVMVSCGSSPKELGTHHMFISEVVAVNAEKELFDEKTGVFRLNDAEPLCYLHGKYYLTGKYIGKFGFSVQKKKKKGRERKA